MNIFAFSKPSRLLFHYGIFSLICHATAILFICRMALPSTPVLLFHRFFPMIEHSLVGFIVLLIGIMGIEYIEKKQS